MTFITGPFGHIEVKIDRRPPRPPRKKR
jgi:hypothetical protein